MVPAVGSHRSDAGANRPQQERRKMRVISGLRFSVALGAPRFRTTDRGHARRLCRGGRHEGCGRCLRLRAGTAASALGMPQFAFTALVSTLISAPGSARLALTPRLAAAARTFPGTLARAMFARLIGLAGRTRVHGIIAFGGGNVLPDQPFDRSDRFVVERGDDRNRGAGASGAAGTADAMHVVVGMMRYVEIEDVADGGNVEAAGGNIGGDQQRDLTLAELIERRGARRLVHVAMQRADAEAVLLQRFVDDGDFALAIAEDDCVVEILGVAQQAAKDFALLVRLTAATDLELRYTHRSRGGLRDFDPRGIVQEGFGDAADFRRHRRGEEQGLPRG